MSRSTFSGSPKTPMRMMPDFCPGTTVGSSVRRRGDRLEVWKGDEKLSDLRLFDLERLVIFGSVQLTTPALGLLLDRGVDVTDEAAQKRGEEVEPEEQEVEHRQAGDPEHIPPAELALEHRQGRQTTQRDLCRQQCEQTPAGAPQRLEPRPQRRALAAGQAQLASGGQDAGLAHPAAEHLAVAGGDRLAKRFQICRCVLPQDIGAGSVLELGILT